MLTCFFGQSLYKPRKHFPIYEESYGDILQMYVSLRVSIGFLTHYGRKPHLLLRVGSRAACGQTKVRGIPNPT
jgi:hypothetical protein